MMVTSPGKSSRNLRSAPQDDRQILGASGGVGVSVIGILILPPNGE